MAEMVALAFIVCVFGLVMAFYLGSSSMSKVIGPVLGIMAAVIGCLVAGFAFASFLVWIFMLLWNVSVVPYFGLAALTFWKAWGFVLVSGFLFKGSGTAVTQATRGIKARRRK